MEKVLLGCLDVTKNSQRSHCVDVLDRRGETFPASAFVGGAVGKVVLQSLRFGRHALGMLYCAGTGGSVVYNVAAAVCAGIR